jgi:hypothetical protein
MPPALRSAQTTLEAIEELAGAGLSAQELLDQAAARIDRVVPSDGFFLGATDPHTALAIGVGVVHNLPPELCAPTWNYEFHVPDVLKFTDIARSGRAVADLHDATGGNPERSPRWREYRAASGFRSEVRSTFTDGGAIWGIAQFDRLGDAPRYSDDEKAWLERLAPVLARGLRQALVTSPAAAAPDRGPGLVVLDRDGGVLTATGEAGAWLDEVEGAFTARDGAVPMPVEALAYAARFRAAAARGEADGVPRARLLTQSGVWLLMHASMLQGTDNLALIIEPAKAADIAPLIVEAYGLPSARSRSRGSSHAAWARRRSPGRSTSRRTPCATT